MQQCQKSWWRQKYQYTGGNPDKLTVAQLKIILDALTRDGDKALPTYKGDLLLRLVEWEAMGLLSVEEEVSITIYRARNELKRAEYDS